MLENGVLGFEETTCVTYILCHYTVFYRTPYFPFLIKMRHVCTQIMINKSITLRLVINFIY